MARRRITFRQLQTFAEVARLSSVSRAAEALHLSQPAVSLQLRQISDALGLPVLEQEGRQIRLSAAGQELLLAARALDDVWNRFESAIAALKGLRRGRLRVALVTTAKYFLPRMLGDFYQQHPDIDLQLEIANRAAIVERLRGNQDDLYVMSHPPEDLDIVCHPFLDNEHVVLAPLGHWACARRQSLQALAGEAFLLREPGSGSRHAIDAHLRAAGVALQVRLALASNEAIRELVASGMGLAVLSRHAIGAHPEQHGLAVLDVEGFPVKGRWSVVHLRGKHLSLPAQAFLDQLIASAQSVSVPQAGAKII